MIRYKDKLLDSELTNYLYSKLLGVWNFPDWALGVISDLKSSFECQEILNIIEKGNATPNKISLQALKFRGIVGIPMEEFDGNPEDIINLDDE